VTPLPPRPERECLPGRAGCRVCSARLTLACRVRAWMLVRLRRRATCRKGRTFRTQRGASRLREKRDAKERSTDKRSWWVPTSDRRYTPWRQRRWRRRRWPIDEASERLAKAGGRRSARYSSHTPSGTAASHGPRSFVDTAGWRHEPRDDWPAPRCPDTWIVVEQAWQFDAQWFSALVKCHRHAPDRSGYNPRFAARSETFGSSRGRACGHFSRVDSPLIVDRLQNPCPIRKTTRADRITDLFRQESELERGLQNEQHDCPIHPFVLLASVCTRNVLRTQRVSIRKFWRRYNPFCLFSFYLYLSWTILFSLARTTTPVWEKER